MNLTMNFLIIVKFFCIVLILTIILPYNLFLIFFIDKKRLLQNYKNKPFLLFILKNSIIEQKKQLKTKKSNLNNFLKMFSKIFYIILVLSVLIGLFFTNLFSGEYQNDIYQYTIKIIYSKIFFWICIVIVYLITTILLYQFILFGFGVL